MADTDPFIIPLDTLPNYSQTVELSGEFFTIELVENVVNNSVVMNLYSDSGDRIICGVRVVFGLNLLAGITIEGLPKGSLILVKGGANRDLEVGDTLENTLLCYFEKYAIDLGGIYE